MTRVLFLLLAASGAALAGEPTPVPEPSTVLLMGGGIAALILAARRRRARK